MIYATFGSRKIAAGAPIRGGRVKKRGMLLHLYVTRGVGIADPLLFKRVVKLKMCIGEIFW